MKDETIVPRGRAVLFRVNGVLFTFFVLFEANYRREPFYISGFVGHATVLGWPFHILEKLDGKRPLLLMRDTFSPEGYSPIPSDMFYCLFGVDIVLNVAVLIGVYCLIRAVIYKHFLGRMNDNGSPNGIPRCRN